VVGRASNVGKIFLALLCGILVGGASAAGHWFTIPHDRGLLIHLFLGDTIAAFLTVVICLALLIRHEEVHFVRATSCVIIVSELNHDIRTAVFPLCLVAQRTDNDQMSRLADRALAQINVALRDATAHAISGRFPNLSADSH